MKREYKVTESGYPKFKAVLNTESGTIKVMKLFYGYKRYQTIATLSLEELSRFFKDEHERLMVKWKGINKEYVGNPLFDLTTSARQVSAVVQRITGKEV